MSKMERITQARKKSRERATAHFVRSVWGTKRKRWLHLYIVYPPPSRPFLPSDEALRTLVGTVPEMRFYQSERFSDRDLFMVYGKHKNLLTVRAEDTARQMRKQFLSDVERMSLSERDTPAHVLDACAAFLKECGFVSVEWNGEQAIAHDRENKRYEGRRITGGTFWRPFKNFQHLCTPVLPFTQRAAQE